MNFVDKTLSLTPEVYEIAILKGTERPNVCHNKIDKKKKNGTLICRVCGIALFRYQDKFNSWSGWPSFDTPIKDYVLEIKENDGTNRTEIKCKRCYSHLGHVFYGENFTSKNKRYCLNNAIVEFIDRSEIENTNEAIFAMGCFWQTEAIFKKVSEVLKTEVGYIGGNYKNPTYEQVCARKTGHFEGLRVVYDPKQISYKQILQIFFNNHNYSQENGQGVNIGKQYKSAIFYYNEMQKNIATKFINLLKKEKKVATVLKQVSTFWPAEDYHQNYLKNH